MNIAMAHSNFIFPGGVERYILEVTRRLAARHRVTLYTSKYIPAATYPGLAEWPITVIPEWKWATTRLKEDVIFTHNHAPNLLAYANKRVGYFAHSFMDDTATIRPDIALRRLLDRGAMKRNQRILANSKFTAARFHKLYHRPATDVVYGGIDPLFFNLAPKTGNYALYAGRFDPTKGLDRLVDWWQSIDYDLVMIGSGDPAYIRSLQRHHNPRITILEPRYDEELATIYQNCRFFVFLPFAETLGLVALEAMAASKPIVGANAGALKETVIHDTTGILINSEEDFCRAVHHLITSDRTCECMGASARQHVQQFTWDNITRHIEQISQEMVNAQV